MVTVFLRYTFIFLEIVQATCKNCADGIFVSLMLSKQVSCACTKLLENAMLSGKLTIDAGQFECFLLLMVTRP